MIKVGRVLIVILSFVLDVRVRADVPSSFAIESQTGQVEMEEVGVGATDVESFKKSIAKIQWQGFRMGLKENSFVSFDSTQAYLHKGSLFVDSESGDSDSLRISTRFGEIKNPGKATFTVSVNGERMTLSVLTGSVKLNDRLGGEERTVKSGYQVWAGGIKSSGKRAKGVLEALNYSECVADLKEFGNIDPKEFNIAADHLNVAWKKAVNDVAEQTQDQIKGDMQLLDEWMAENAKRNAASVRAKADLKRRFKAHALDLPY